MWFMMKMQAANAISIARCIGFGWCLYGLHIHADKYSTAHTWIFVVTGLLYAADYLDGLVARWTGSDKYSSFGKDLDPVGDKFVAISMLVYLMTLEIFPIWIFGLIAIREVAVTQIRYYSTKFDIQFDTSQTGKFRTNLVGFGGTFVYAAYCWGWLIPWIITGIALSIILANFIFFPKSFIMRKYEKLADKIAVLVSMILAVIYPPVTIPLAILLITLYTLWAYWMGFYVKARDRGVARQFWFGRLYLIVFRKRLEGELEKPEGKVFLLEQAKIRALKKLALKREQLDIQEKRIEVKFMKKIAKTVDPAKRKRWPKIAFALLLTLIGSSVLGLSLATGFYFSWFGKYTPIITITIITVVFLVQLIKKRMLPEKPKQQQTTKQQ